MKTRITLALLVLALSAQAGVPTLVTVPWSVNATNLTDYSRTNTPTWWNGGTNFLGIPPGVDYSLGVPAWMAWQAANYNCGLLSGFLSTNLVQLYGDATGTGAVAVAVTVNNIRGTLTNNTTGGAAYATNTPTGQPVASKTDVTATTNLVMTMVMSKGFLTANSSLNAAKVVGTLTNNTTGSAATAGVATNTPDGIAIPRLQGTNTWTGTNNFGTGKLLVNGVPVGGGGTGGGGPYVFAVSPNRLRSDQSGTLKITGSGFQESGTWISFNGTSAGGTYVSATEIDVDWTGGVWEEGVYDVGYNSINGTFTLLGGFTIGPDPASGVQLSSRSVAYGPGTSYMDAGQTNVISSFPTLAGLSYTNSLGNPKLLYSFDDQETWEEGSPSLVTNVPVIVAFYSGKGSVGINPTPVPVPGEVSNLIIYTLDAPQLFGTTNELYGESFRVGPPIDPDDVTPKNYVDGLFQTTAWWSAQQPVQLNSHSLHYSGSWEVYPNYTTNSDQLHFSWLGTDLVRLDNPMGAFQTFASIDLVGTNVLVSVPTNGLAQAPALRYTRYLTPLNWLAVSATNWIDGTNYVLQFGRPFTDSGYVSAYAVSTNAAVMSVAGDLSVAGAWRGAVCTVTNSNSTTWGLGAGVMRWDTNYVYVSVATNRWKRAALSTW